MGSQMAWWNELASYRGCLVFLGINRIRTPERRLLLVSFSQTLEASKKSPLTITMCKSFSL